MKKLPIVVTGLIVGLSVFGWRLLPDRAGPSPSSKDRRGGEHTSALERDAALEIETLRLQVAMLLARLANTQRCEPSPPHPTVEAAEPPKQEVEAPPSPPSQARSDFPTRETAPTDTESFVRSLARQTAVPFDLTSVTCTEERCRIEAVAQEQAGPDPLAIQSFVGLLPDAIIQPDPEGGDKVTVLFSRNVHHL